MGTAPRLLTVMGSGETAPTMVKVHRELVARAGGPAVLLDTPFGFQTNADDLVAKAQAYFRESVGVDIGLASYRDAARCVGLDLERTLRALRAAHYVFAGPGSPTYALRQWTGSPVAAALREKLDSGGVVTFASAAALTVGVATVPVYEVYKAGEEPHWLPGLDLLSVAGLRAAVVPHYDNAEGGRHDTRYCYLGEERLARLEAELPDDVWVLGVDEHTAVTFDLDAATATIAGRGVVTVRARGRSVQLPAGTVVATDELAGAAHGGGEVSRPRPRRGEAEALTEAHDAASLGDAVRDCEAAFERAVASRDADAAAAAVLSLETLLDDWSHDSLQSDDRARGRGALRAMVARLADLAAAGSADPRERVAPFVGLLLELRAAARRERRFADSDRVRDGLEDAGVEVRDTPDGVEWDLRQR